MPTNPPPTASQPIGRRAASVSSELELISHSLEQTRRIGGRLASALQPGDLILLEGEFGVGKTSLVQGLAAGLGIDSRYVTSPTFALINEYTGRLPLYHMDLYRLDTPEQVAALGLDEYLAGDGVTVIEWPALAASLLPAEHLRLTLAHMTDTKRALRFRASGPRALALLAAFKDQAFAHET